MAMPLSFPDQAKQIVVDHFNGTRDPSDTDRYQLKMEDVYVVWFCKTLQNWKALVSTILPDLTYYEVTYNGNENVIYLDVYTKSVNREIPCDTPITRMPAGPATSLPKSFGGASGPIDKKLKNLMGPGEPPEPVLPNLEPDFKYRAPYRTPYD